MDDVNVLNETVYFKYAVVGGGIAGVSCAETLSQSFSEDKILLLTASPLVKKVSNFRMLTKQLEEFDIEEKPGYVLESEFPNIEVVYGALKKLDSLQKVIHCSNGKIYEYKYLSLCTGSTPKLIDKTNPYVIGIRDTDTVEVFQKKLKHAKRILVVGNGGIATEIVHEINDCEVIWAVKDKSITSTFIDIAAAQFLLNNKDKEKVNEDVPCKRLKYTISEFGDSSILSKEEDILGCALGPDWHKKFKLKGKGKSNVHVVYEVEVESINSIEEFSRLKLGCENPFDDEDSNSYPVYVKFSNSKVYGCDFIVSATGVVPNTKPFNSEKNFNIAADGGVVVNENMQTSVCDVYAAGDVCTVDWKYAQFWQQMRLWSQARQMGCYTGQCIAAKENDEEISLDFCFELFAHITTFFNYKVILLGRYNAQSLGKNYELLLRITEGKEYIKVVLKDGCMQGAILIGETDLEETFENLILNQMDLSIYGEDLLSPDVDIDDYFD